MKYRIQTLGCKVNQFETQALETMLQARGVAAAAADSYEILGAELARAARAGDTILLMGARDPQLPVFAREMAAKTRHI